MRQHRDQRVLAEKGRLTAHVRARHQPEPRAFRQRTVIGDEPLARACHRRLDHRMTAARHVETAVVDQFGPHPAALDRALGQPARDIQPGQRVRRRGDPFARGERGGGQFLQMRGLGGQRMGARLRDLAGDLVQLGRVEADHARQRLAMGKARIRLHQRVGRACGHLDMIAEHAIVTDLQRGDAGLLAELGLQRGDGAPPPCARIAQIVERHVIARRDIAALARLDRRRGTSARRSRSISSPCPRKRGVVSRSRGGPSVSCSDSAQAPSRPSRNCPRSRGEPRPAAIRPMARPISGSARKAARKRSRSAASSWKCCTRSSRASIASRSINGAPISPPAPAHPRPSPSGRPHRAASPCAGHGGLGQLQALARRRVDRHRTRRLGQHGRAEEGQGPLAVWSR